MFYIELNFQIVNSVDIDTCRMDLYFTFIQNDYLVGLTHA